MSNFDLEKETLHAPHMTTLLNAFADSKSFAEMKYLPEIKSELMEDDTVVDAMAKLIAQSKSLKFLKLGENLSSASAVTLLRALNGSDSKENFTKKPDINKEGQSFGFDKKGLVVTESLYQFEEVINELAKFIESTVSQSSPNLRFDTISSKCVATLLEAYSKQEGSYDHENLPSIPNKAYSDDEVIEALAKLIGKSTALKSLRFCGNNTRADQIIILLKALTQSKSCSMF